MLRAGGVKIARDTLDRYLDSAPPCVPTPGEGPDPSVAGLVAQAAAAVDADDPGSADNLAVLRGAQRRIGAAMREWEPRVGNERQAVLSYTALVTISATIAKAIHELSPRPEHDRYKPLEAAAMAALLARAEAAARVESGAVARAAEYDRMIEDGTLTIGPGHA